MNLHECCQFDRLTFHLGSKTMKMIVTLLTILSLTNNHTAFCEEQKLSFFYEIAKETCHDINSIRFEMDRINHEILERLTERTAYVKRAGDLKSKMTKIADDRQRVADQEKKIIDKSIELELPTEISLPAFRSIMENSIKFQQDYIDQLTGGS